MEVLAAEDQSARMQGVSKEALEWLEKFLEPFHLEKTDLEGSGKSYPILPLALPANANLREQLEVTPNDNYHCILLKQRGLSFMEAKYKPSMKQKVATFLWPNDRHLAMLEPCEREEVS